MLSRRWKSLTIVSYDRNSNGVTHRCNGGNRIVTVGESQLFMDGRLEQCHYR